MASSRFLEFAWAEVQEVDPAGQLDSSLTRKPVQALLRHRTAFWEFAISSSSLTLVSVYSFASVLISAWACFFASVLV